MPQWVGVVEREAADKHDASWSLLAVRYRGEGRGLAPEGGRREDAQARQADGDDECRRRRFEQAQFKTSEVENRNSTLRKKSRGTFSAASDKFETKFKDHELEDGTIALVLLSTGRRLTAQHSGCRFFDGAGRQIHARTAARVRRRRT